MHLEALDFALGSKSFDPVSLFNDQRLIDKTGITKVFQEDGTTSNLILRAAKKTLSAVAGVSSATFLVI